MNGIFNSDKWIVFNIEFVGPGLISKYARTFQLTIENCKLKSY